MPKFRNESDSSLGDSLFSYHSSNRRYFGSSESCRFGFDCRRCSLDVDKCSFSDTCRYDKCRNCDCSSSYFSSDFDEANNLSRKSSTRCSTNSNNNSNNINNNLYNLSRIYATPIDELKPRYAENFMKHVSNVKRGQEDIEMYRRPRGIGSTSTVEYSSSSDHALRRENAENGGTMKRRRNKTTGTIPKMLSDTPQAKSLDSSCNIGNKRSQFQTIEQLDRKVATIDTKAQAPQQQEQHVSVAVNNDEDEVFVSGQSGDALKPLARRVSQICAPLACRYDIEVL